jgi:LysM repeat protein
MPGFFERSTVSQPAGGIARAQGACQSAFRITFQGRPFFVVRRLCRFWLGVSVTPAVVAAITGTPVALDTPTASVVPTATWTLTATLSIPPGVETPIGSSPQLLIHRVILGESLPLLAKRYGSSSEAIQKINYQMPVPLWEGWMVVIPLKTTDVSALPVFKTYQVKESSLTLEKVAQSLDVNLDLIQRYNPLQAEDVLPVDCWLLIPH